jgi:hypothetical protein
MLQQTNKGQLKETPKTRLADEFKTGKKHADICAALTKDGLGEKIYNGTVVEWNRNSLGLVLRSMGLRKLAPYKKGANRAAIYATNPEQEKSTLDAVRSLLKVDSMPADERITLALMVIERN